MKKTLLFCTVCALLVSACTTPGKRTAIGAASGAAIGAAAGAIISHSTGGKSGTGAIIGGLSGLAAGGALGNYYDKQAKELAAIADVVKGDNGIQVFLKNDILFDIGSAELSPNSIQTLADLNKVLKKYPKNRIVVQGYTDSTGSDELAVSAAVVSTCGVVDRSAESFSPIDSIIAYPAIPQAMQMRTNIDFLMPEFFPNRY